MKRALILATGLSFLFLAGCAAIAGIGKDGDYTFVDEEDSGSISTKDSGGPTRDSGSTIGDSGPGLDAAGPCTLASQLDTDQTEAGVDCNKCVADHCCAEANGCFGVTGCYACVRDKSSCALDSCNCSGGNGNADNGPALALYQCINTNCKNVSATNNCLTF